MLTRNRIAGFMMSFGLLGLAISTFGISSTAASPDQATVAIAISSGSHLNLIQDEALRASRHAGTGHQLVCGRVIRSSIADIGLNCRKSVAVRTVASMIH